MKQTPKLFARAFREGFRPSVGEMAKRALAAVSTALVAYWATRNEGAVVQLASALAGLAVFPVLVTIYKIMILPERMKRETLQEEFDQLTAQAKEALQALHDREGQLETCSRKVEAATEIVKLTADINRLSAYETTATQMFNGFERYLTDGYLSGPKSLERRFMPRTVFQPDAPVLNLQTLPDPIAFDQIGGLQPKVQLREPHSDVVEYDPDDEANQAFVAAVRQNLESAREWLHACRAQLETATERRDAAVSIWQA